MTHVAVLISGEGSNLQAMLDAVESGGLPGVKICLVVSNRAQAGGIGRAIRHGVPVAYFPLAPYRLREGGRDDYDADLARLVRAFDAEWVVLAGWMHVLGDGFLRAFRHRVINLHPALPGTFPGVGAIERAYVAFRQGLIDHTGVMVHLVPDAGIDSGPVLLSEIVPITTSDTLQDLQARMHACEHRLLVQAIRESIVDA